MFDADVADWAFNDSMLITDVEWTPRYAIITVDVNPVGVVAAQKSLADATKALESRGIPESWTP